MAETPQQNPEQVKEAQAKQRFEERGPIGQTLQCFNPASGEAGMCWKQVVDYHFGDGMAGRGGKGLAEKNKQTEDTGKKLENPN